MKHPIPHTVQELRTLVAYLELKDTIQTRVPAVRDAMRATVEANRESAERARLLDIKLSERRDRRSGDEQR